MIVSFRIKALPDDNEEIPTKKEFHEEIAESFKTIGDVFNGPVEVSDVHIDEVA